MELQEDVATIEAAGIQLVGVSYDSVEVLRRFTGREDITFPLLSDDGSKLIKAFGILNEESREPIPHPGTFIVNRDGKITAKLFYPGYRKRHLSSDIIAAAKE